MSNYDQKVRRDLRTMLMANGLEADRAEQVVDLACHAADRAQDGLAEVIKAAADSALGMMAFEIALQLATARLTGLFTRTRECAASLGIPQYQSAVLVPS